MFELLLGLFGIFIALGITFLIVWAYIYYTMVGSRNEERKITTTNFTNMKSIYNSIHSRGGCTTDDMFHRIEYSDDDSVYVFDSTSIRILHRTPPYPSQEVWSKNFIHHML